TVAGLAEAMRPATAPAAASEPFALVPADDRASLGPGLADAYPITSLQLGMLFHSGRYHSVSGATVRRPFDQERLVAALTRLLENHEVLRTSFAVTGHAVPLALVHRSAPLRLTVTDLRGRKPEAVAAALAAMRAQEERTPLAAGAAPLIRFRVAV